MTALPQRVPYAAAARTLLRETVLTAVDDLARTRGWSATTMTHVAAAAGVSRQTLYNEFGSRSALVESYVGREVEALVARVADAVRANAGDAHTALRTAFALFLELASDEPVVQLIAAGAGDVADAELHRLLTTLGRQLAGASIAELIPQVWPQIAAADAQLVSDALVRLAISHALVPTSDPDVAAAAVERMFAPFVDQLLGA